MAAKLADLIWQRSQRALDYFETLGPLFFPEWSFKRLSESHVSGFHSVTFGGGKVTATLIVQSIDQVDMTNLHIHHVDETV